MKRLSIISIVLISALCSFYSCKKAIIETPYTRLEGRWKLTSTGIDGNGDSIIQSNEITPQNPAVDDEIVFRLDKTGVETVTANNLVDSFNFTYEIDKDIIHRTGKGNDVRDYYMASVTSSDLELTEHLSTGLTALFFSKH